MAVTSVRTFVSGDHTAGILEIVEGDQVIGRIALDAHDFESLIYEMAQVRQLLPDPVPETLDIGARAIAITEPNVAVSHTLGTSPDAIALSVRHPGLGWITGLFSREKAKVLGQYLIYQAWSPRR